MRAVREEDEQGGDGGLGHVDWAGSEQEEKGSSRLGPEGWSGCARFFPFPQKTEKGESERERRKEKENRKIIVK